MNWPSWYYKALTQVLIVSFAAFCCPGLFNAMNGLGGAGQKNPHQANMANASLYAFFSVFGYFGGFFFNVLGPRFLLVFGGAFYSIYSAGMYISGNVDGAGWVAILVGALLGIGAGMFWTAQGALTIAYATPQTKGKYIAIFWVIFNLGGTIGGLISFGVNYNATTDQANPASYFTFVGLMIVGACLGLFICNPLKVHKEDGSPVIMEKPKGPVEEITGAAAVILDRYMLMLTLFFLASNFYYTYQFNFVNGMLFNIRSRGLNSALYWAMQMLAAYILGLVVDMKSLSARSRGLYGLLFVVVSFALAFSLGIWIQYGFEGGYDKNNPIVDPVDFTESARAAPLIIGYLFYGWADAALQAYAYWIMGAVAGSDTSLCARYAGYYKGIQSIGACVAWSIDLSSAVTYEIQFWVGFALLVLGIIPTYFAVRGIPSDEELALREAKELAEGDLQVGEGNVVAAKVADVELVKDVSSNSRRSSSITSSSVSRQ